MRGSGRVTAISDPPPGGFVNGEDSERARTVRSPVYNTRVGFYPAFAQRSVELRWPSNPV
jgi:hypothetical protein